MPLPGHQASRHFHDYQQRALKLAGQYEVLGRHLEQLETSARAELDRVALELASSYLPGLTPQYLAQVEKLTGFSAFQRRDPIEAMAHERHVLENAVATIRSDQRYVQREEHAGPHGTLRTKLAQAHEMIAPWHADCQRYEALEGFMELVQRGYDTPAFGNRWWQGEYWRIWKQGDAICEALGLKDFGDDVLPAYRKSADQRAFWQQEIQGLEAELTAVANLVQEHDQSVQRLENLARSYLEQCQQLLKEHLVECDVQLLSQWQERGGGESRSVEMGLRKLSGLRAKRDFLRQIYTYGVAATVDALRERAGKYGRKSQKLLRPKHAHRMVADRELEAVFPEKAKKMSGRSQKIRALVDRIAAYDSYDRFSLDNDPYLWWWEQTGGKRPPRIMGTLHQYYEQNPGARPVLDRDDGRAVAQATARAKERGDDLLGLS